MRAENGAGLLAIQQRFNQHSLCERAKLWSLRQLEADDLNERGVPTPGGGAAWSHVAVLRIVRRMEMAALL